MERRAGFFNSLSIRLPLSVIGGILYGFLAYAIIIFLDLSSELALFVWVFVSFFYVGSRFLILFSGIDSPYYSKERKGISKQFYEGVSFYQTAQRVGKFYHYHDIVLFIFLTISSIVFIIALIIDWTGCSPMGSAFQSIRDAFISLGRK